jgi:hypothetical protein
LNTYQAIYDAAFTQLDLSWQKEIIVQSITCAAETIQNEHTRPSVLMRPKIYMDGDAWCALYGDNLQDGVAGFGDTPEKAMLAFDAAWKNSRTQTANALASAAPELHDAAQGLMAISIRGETA